MDNCKNKVSQKYLGRILHGDYSAALKQKVRDSITLLQNFEKTGSKIIPYISAWHGDDRKMWYEYTGQGFCELLHTDCDSIADALRKAIVDQRVYRYLEVDDKVEEKIITRDELLGSWKGLREEVKKTGEVDAVYKIAIRGEKSVWLKDLANIESFPEDDIHISVGFLTNVTKEMALKDLFEEIGYIDELTKLPRRSILDRILELNVGNFQRGHIVDFILMMIDVDHFKAVNDKYGHQAGDYVLSTLSEVMTSLKRKQDEFGRYGGEEFYGFTVGDISLGANFAERLRARIEQTDFIFKGSPIKITVSIGLASAVQVNLDNKLTADELIRLADKRLYMAKSLGRNQVVCHGV